MASVGDVDLGTEESEVVAGAAFYDPASFSEGPSRLLEVEGHRVRVRAGGAVVSMLNEEPQPDELAATCLELALKAMDFLASTGGSVRALRDASDKHIVWWKDASGTTLRVVAPRPMNVSASLSMREADLGTEKAQPILWNPAMRYFRLSQLADDVFDSYRHAFLALEALLDATVSPDAPKGERHWFAYALSTVLPRFGLELAQYLIVGVPTGEDAVEQFMDEQWTALRCSTFHAKMLARGSLLPGVLEDRSRVGGALEPLFRLIIDLQRAAFDVVFPSGGMTLGGFDLFMRHLVAHGATLAVSTGRDDVSAFNSDELLAVPRVDLRTSYTGTLDRLGYIAGFAGEAATTDLPPTVSSVFSYTKIEPSLLAAFPMLPSGPLACHQVPTVDLQGIDRLEVVERWILNNVRMPKSRFEL